MLCSTNLTTMCWHACRHVSEPGRHLPCVLSGLIPTWILPNMHLYSTRSMLGAQVLHIRSGRTHPWTASMHAHTLFSCMQWNPEAPIWGAPYWGHVISKDMVHWERMPPALVPDTEYDYDGVFSGSATLLEDGTPILFYTGTILQHPGPCMVTHERCNLLAKC